MSSLVHTRAGAAICRRVAFNAGPRCYSQKTLGVTRAFSTEIPREVFNRPPPPTEKPHVTTVSDTSKPRPYYMRHPQRDLPRIKSKWPAVLAVTIVAIVGWGGFLIYVTNQEKITSSVVKQIMRDVRSDPKLKDVLGDAIRPQPEWWLNGDPRIRGQISTLQGAVDVSFRIRGSKDSGTLYFTSIRREKGQPFKILRFKVIADDGTVINLLSGGLPEA